MSENIKKFEFKECPKIITKANEGKTELIKTLNIKNIKKSSYVKYNRKSWLNYYKEIEDYINDNTKIPLRLKNNKKAKRKIQSKRRARFPKLVKDNYRLADYRLEYKRILNNKEVWRSISYEVEIEPLLDYVHYNNLYLKKDKMVDRIF